MPKALSTPCAQTANNGGCAGCINADTLHMMGDTRFKDVQKQSRSTHTSAQIAPLNLLSMHLPHIPIYRLASEFIHTIHRAYICNRKLKLMNI